jgi:hypothetical protein
MKIKKFLIVFLISIFTFATITQAQAQPIPAISNTYKQGIYDLSSFNGYRATTKLITPNTVVTLILVDNNGNLRQFIKLDDVNEIIKLGAFKEGDIGIMLGTGEIAISPYK